MDKSVIREAQKLVDAARTALDCALGAAAKATSGGKEIDTYQVECQRIADLATDAAAARALAQYASDCAHEEGQAALLAEQAFIFASAVAMRSRVALEAQAAPFDVAQDVLRRTVESAETIERARAGLAVDRVRAVGRRVLDTAGVNNCWLEETAAMTRDSVRAFARAEVAPRAERIHRGDELVPEDLISKMAKLGYFGMSVPEEYGGLGMGNLIMIITTEELSAASLGAAGSLITRPEILTKALLKGGTEEQKKKWLPPIASGELMVAISVTEPDVGSDVASIKCRAERRRVEGRDGFVLNGAKAWCTFAGRANVLALLARTNPDPALGARGLSLFVVEKDPSRGHDFESRQPTGGVIVGRADATPGYRGMHSYTLSIDDYFVPAENLVGGEAGEGKGFYLQMSGFAAGRLQTGGRAVGLAQAALERTAEYVNDRSQFGRPVGKFPLTEYRVGWMATEIAAARQLTYAAARAMDRDEGVSLEPAMAKLFASDVAVRVTQEGQLLHGGWGYAEEFPISRYVVDALVLPIFEGVKPILQLKVIARSLLG